MIEETSYELKKLKGKCCTDEIKDIVDICNELRLKFNKIDYRSRTGNTVPRSDIVAIHNGVQRIIDKLTALPSKTRREEIVDDLKNRRDELKDELDDLQGSRMKPEELPIYLRKHRAFVNSFTVPIIKKLARENIKSEKRRVGDIVVERTGVVEHEAEKMGGGEEL